MAERPVSRQRVWKRALCTSTILAAGLACSPAFAQTTWTNGTGNDDWFTNGNWTANTPGAGTDALITDPATSGDVVINQNSPLLAASLTITNGNILCICNFGSMTIGGQFLVDSDGGFNTSVSVVSVGSLVIGGGSSFVNVSAGATFTTGSTATFVGVGGNGRLSMLGGTFNAGGAGDQAITLSVNGTLQVLGGTVNAAVVNGSGTVDFNSAANMSFIVPIAGSVRVEKRGTGTTTLSGANTYSGATNVNQGTLRAGAADVFGTLSATSVAAGATLDLNGFS